MTAIQALLQALNAHTYPSGRMKQGELSRCADALGLTLNQLGAYQRGQSIKDTSIKAMTDRLGSHLGVLVCLVCTSNGSWIVEIGGEE